MEKVIKAAEARSHAGSRKAPLPSKPSWPKLKPVGRQEGPSAHSISPQRPPQSSNKQRVCSVFEALSLNGVQAHRLSRLRPVLHRPRPQSSAPLPFLPRKPVRYLSLHAFPLPALLPPTPSFRLID